MIDAVVIDVVVINVVVDVGLQFTTTLKLKYLIDDTLTRCSLDPESPLVDVVGDSSYGDSDRPTLRELGRASQFRRVVTILPCCDKPRTIILHERIVVSGSSVRR